MPALRPWGIDRLLWQRAISRRESWVWFWLMVFAPLALVGGAWLHYKISERRGLQITSSRPAAIRHARKYAAEYGVRTQGWSEAMWVEVKASLCHYVRNQNAERSQVLRHVVHPAVLHVRLVSPDDTQSVEVLLDETGSPYGLHRRQPSSMDTAPRNDLPFAQGLAEETMKDCLGAEMPHMVVPAAPDLKRRPNGLDSFQWQAKLPEFPELTLTYTADVRGLTLLDSSVAPTLDPAFERRLDPLGQFQQVLSALGWLSVVVLCLIVFVRYVQRTLQGEVSRERMLLVSAFVGSCYLLFMACGDQIVATQSGNGDQPPFYIILLFGGVVMLLMGAAAGVAYAGTEGDLREWYPDKLTSLDCLLVGRWFSRNVGTAIVLGTVMAAWLVLLRSGLDWTLGDVQISSQQVDFIQLVPFSRSPWAMILLSLPTNAIMASLFGLLLPRTVSLRLTRRRKVALGLFLALAYLGTCVVAERTASLHSLLAVGMVRVAAMTFAFYTLDFLTCLVLTGVVSGVTSTVGLAQTVPFVESAAWMSGGIGLVVLATGIYGVWRGRVVTDEQVRPQYAKNVAERLSLQEEILATREAQVRLLPHTLPQVPGLSLSAACKAAEHVGGDFYDFLPLGPQRVAVLLVEGGRGGLATALAMALTKGYVTQRASTGGSPAAMLQSLHGALDTAIADGARLPGVLYAVIDTFEQTLSYARVGAWPRLLAIPDSSTLEKSMALGSDRTLREGTITLRPGTRVVFYTDGLKTQLGGNVESWLRSKVTAQSMADAEHLQQAVLARTSRRTTDRVQDDITLIMAATSEAQIQSREHVA